MSVIRAFIAVDLPNEIHDCLAYVSNQLKEQIGDVPVRWVTPTKYSPDFEIPWGCLPKQYRCLDRIACNRGDTI